MDKIKDENFFFVIMNMDRTITIKNSITEAKEWIVQHGGCRKLIKARAIRVLSESKVKEVLNKDTSNIIKFPKKST